MIKFFRRIRRNLLEVGKTTKYFKYAIGEIFLVMIGILLALQVNNWNGHRKDRTLIKSYLAKVHKELETNKSTLENELSNWEERIISASILIKSLQNQAILSGDTLEFTKGLRRAGRFYAPVLDFKIYDEMIANGILGKMKEVEIKEDIQNVYYRLKSFETRFTQRKDVPRNMANRVRSHDAIQFTINNHSLENPSGNWDYEMSIDYTSLYKDHRIINDLARLLDYMRDLILSCKRQLRICTSVQERIEIEIEK